jgi:hypothetical protein
MTEEVILEGIVVAVLPPGTTYRIRLEDSRKIICTLSRGYIPDRLPDAAKYPKPQVGDEVRVRLVTGGRIQGMLIRE